MIISVDLNNSDFQENCLSTFDSGFVYHNKLPKCGSTTMHAILGVLARWNNFRYLKLEPSLVKFFDGEKMGKLINTLLERKKVINQFDDLKDIFESSFSKK